MAVGFLQLFPLCSPDVLDVEPSGENVAKVGPTSDERDMKMPQVGEVSPIFRHLLVRTETYRMVENVHTDSPECIHLLSTLHRIHMQLNVQRNA